LELGSSWGEGREARHRWLTPVILATWKAEMGRMEVRGQPGQIVLETPSLKQLVQNELQVWLKRQGACFARVKP
jgi:hypothetical protein